MTTLESDEERPLSWVAILPATPVFAAGGDQVGIVSEVLGSQDEDIFHGLVVAHGSLQRDLMVPAEHVKSITNKRVDVDLDDDGLRALPPFEEHASYHLGMVGHLRRRMGWVREDEQPR
jgi:uncharacterized protein YrrD